MVTVIQKNITSQNSFEMLAKVFKETKIENKKRERGHHDLLRRVINAQSEEKRAHGEAARANKVAEERRLLRHERVNRRPAIDNQRMISLENRSRK